MLRNIPVRYTAEELIADFHECGFEGSFDFFYLPIDFDSCARTHRQTRACTRTRARANRCAHTDAFARVRVRHGGQAPWANPLGGLCADPSQQLRKGRLGKLPFSVGGMRAAHHMWDTPCGWPAGA